MPLIYRGSECQDVFLGWGCAGVWECVRAGVLEFSVVNSGVCACCCFGAFGVFGGEFWCVSVEQEMLRK